MHLIDLLLETSHRPSVSLLLPALLVRLLLTHALVLVLQVLDLVPSQRTAELGEVLNDGGPLDGLYLQVLLHAIEDLLECLPGNARVSCGVTSYGAENLSNFLMLTQGNEESDRVHRGGASPALSIVYAFDQLDLLLSDVNLVLRSKLGQVLQPSLFLGLE